MVKSEMSTEKKKRSESGAVAAKDVKRRKHTSNPYEVSTPENAIDLLNGMKHADPVLQLHLTDESDCPDITVNSNILLQTIMYPLSPQSFKDHCFRKKAVYISSNRVDRARDINMNYMFGLDPQQIFEETTSDSIFLWIPSNDKEEKSLQSIDIQDPKTAYILHKHSNYASYCRAPPELEQPLVSSMLRDVGIGLGQYDPTGEKLTTLGRGEVETFIGTKGHLTGWHTDFQENFTIQLSGKKKWTLKQGTVRHPMRGTTPHYKSSDDVIENQIKAARLSNPDYQFGEQDLESNAFGDEVEIIMDAGDILYFPAGMFHKVETVEQGVSINISLMGSTYASLVCKTLEHILLQKEEWREVICTSERQGIDVLEKMKSLINDLPPVVKSLGDSGLAEGMLPPVLRRPPAFETAKENDEFDIDETKGSDSEQRQEIGSLDENASEEWDKEVYSTYDQVEMDSTSNQVDDGIIEGEEDDHVVDIGIFESPEELTVPSGKKGWRKNPLASLMKMKDVKSFYADANNPIKDIENLFILNSNFAGNEMHESIVRVVLKDESGLLERLCSLQEKDLHDSIIKIQAPPSALVYYGFII